MGEETGDPGSLTVAEMDVLIDELQESIGDRAPLRTLHRLMLIRSVALGHGLRESCEILDIPPATGRRWLDEWVALGPASLRTEFAGGRKCLLSPEQLDELAEEADRLKMTTAEAREFVRRSYGVEYSAKQIDHHLRGRGLRHVRPYEIDFGSEEESERVMADSSLMRWTRRQDPLRF